MQDSAQSIKISSSFVKCLKSLVNSCRIKIKNIRSLGIVFENFVYTDIDHCCIIKPVTRHGAND